MDKRSKARDNLEDTLRAYQNQLEVFDHMSDTIARYYDEVIETKEEIILFIQRNPSMRIIEAEEQILDMITAHFDYVNSQARKLRLGND
jgi:hypothetical protein